METHPESKPVLPAVPAQQPGSARILVAEDTFVSSFLRTVLQKHGHKVFIGDAARAGELIRQGGVVADMVITNQPEVFLEFARILPLLYIAASPDPELASQFPICRVLRKPFHNHELLAAVEELADSVVP
jgi:hypothetical protein